MLLTYVGIVIGLIVWVIGLFETDLMAYRFVRMGDSDYRSIVMGEVVYATKTVLPMNSWLFCALKLAPPVVIAGCPFYSSSVRF